MMRLLVWLALLVIGWLFARSFARSLLGGSADAAKFRRERERTETGRTEQLVRDRVCDTYLPRSRAIRHVDPDGSERFFCSEACRQKHLASADRGTGPAA
jgi:hypothetical protein